MTYYPALYWGSLGQCYLGHFLPKFPSNWISLAANGIHWQLIGASLGFIGTPLASIGPHWLLVDKCFPNIGPILVLIGNLLAFIGIPLAIIGISLATIGISLGLSHLPIWANILGFIGNILKFLMGQPQVGHVRVYSHFVSVEFNSNI